MKDIIRRWLGIDWFKCEMDGLHDYIDNVGIATEKLKKDMESLEDRTGYIINGKTDDVKREVEDLLSKHISWFKKNK